MLLRITNFKEYRQQRNSWDFLNTESTQHLYQCCILNQFFLLRCGGGIGVTPNSAKEKGPKKISLEGGAKKEFSEKTGIFDSKLKF